MIPMVDLKEQYQRLKHEIDDAIEGVLQSCQFIMGPNVTAFEHESAEYLGVKHAIGCASGTDALQLALLAAGIGPGDEVITPAFTFIATAEAIRAVGANPVFVDIEPHSFNIDVESARAAVTPASKALLPVHLFGQPANIQALAALCEEQGLLLIEDCAQSFGAAVAGKMTGSFGVCGCYSFFPSKNLGCYGDGGLITTQSDEIADRLRLLRNHGSRERYYHEIVGFNSRLDEIQAAVLRVKSRYINEFNRSRRKVARTYDTLFADTPVTTPVEDGIGEHVYHQYTVLMPKREQVIEHLAQQGIACAIYYPVPLHKQQVFAGEKRPPLPVTEKIAAQCLSLPIYPEMEKAQIQRVVNAVKEVFD